MSVAGRRIDLWVEERYGTAAVNPVIRALLDDLAGAGASVAVRVPELHLLDPGQLLHEPAPDLVLLKSATSLALSLAIADEAQGVRFLNTARATLRAHDKAATAARLAAAGLPVPPTYLFDPRTVGPIDPPNHAGRWVTKPTRAVHGRGVAFHEHLPERLDRLGPIDSGGSYVVDDGTRLAQHRVGGDEPDIKVYVAGDRCFAGRKRFSATSYTADELEPLALDHATSEIVRAAGRALELRCFGVDLRSEAGQIAIVDLNPFPGYRGFPVAASALRSEIERSLEALA